MLLYNNNKTHTHTLSENLKMQYGGYGMIGGGSKCADTYRTTGICDAPCRGPFKRTKGKQAGTTYCTKPSRGPAAYRSECSKQSKITGRCDPPCIVGMWKGKPHCRAPPRPRLAGGKRKRKLPKYCAMSVKSGRCHRARSKEDSKWCESKTNKKGTRYCKYSALGKYKMDMSESTDCKGRPEKNCQNPCTWRTVGGKSFCRAKYAMHGIPVPPDGIGYNMKVPKLKPAVLERYVRDYITRNSLTTERLLEKLGEVKAMEQIRKRIRKEYHHAAKKLVFEGKYRETQGGLFQDDIIINKRGEYVSKKKSKNAWSAAIVAARKALGHKKFVNFNDPELLAKAKEFFYEATGKEAGTQNLVGSGSLDWFF